MEQMTRVFFQIDDQEFHLRTFALCMWPDSEPIYSAQNYLPRSEGDLKQKNSRRKVLFWDGIFLTAFLVEVSSINSNRVFCQIDDVRTPSQDFYSLSVTWVGNLTSALGRGIDSRNRVWNWVTKLHRLAGRYDNPVPTWFLAPHSGN